jgi:hypothetical protein
MIDAMPSANPFRACASASSQLALWSAANLAGMRTERLFEREPFFRRLMRKLVGKRRGRSRRGRPPPSRETLPMLASALMGSNRQTIFTVFGPPKGVAVIDPSEPVWEATTWYYAMVRQRQMAIAITFDEDHACDVEFYQVPRCGLMSND